MNMKTNMNIDFHSHFLANVDDGPEDIEQSLDILRTLKSDGVEIVIATPHLYSMRDTPQTLIKRRDSACEKIAARISEISEISEISDKEQFPRIIKGAEVYFERLPPPQELSELCIGESGFLLLELPYYRKFDREFINELYDFLSKAPFEVILAHIERYLRFADKKTILEIINMVDYSQVNCDSVVSRDTREQTLDLIKSGRAQILGTDAHDMYFRPPRFAASEKIIRKQAGNKVFNEMMVKAKKILKV